MSNFGKGIPLASGFDLGAKAPLDSRIAVQNIQERDAHVINNRAYEGLRVYVIDESCEYLWNGNEWLLIPSKQYVDDAIANVKIDESQLANYATKDEIPTKTSELTNDSNFATESYVDSSISNIKIEGGDNHYLGDEEPTNDNIIWFSNETNYQQQITYDNPIIQEIFSSLRSLKKAVTQLQSDVEYLKANGGGSTPDVPDIPDIPDIPVDPDIPNVNDSYFFLLEDGGQFFCEDGSYLVLEDYVLPITTPILTLEDGSSLLLEDGSYIILEDYVEEVTDSVLTLENGSNLLLEDGSYILLEETIQEIQDSLLLLENSAQLLLENGYKIILER